MSRATKPIDPTSASDPPPGPMSKVVCPFCGTLKDDASQPCSQCVLEDTPGNRQTVAAQLGPWYVHQRRNPAAPGMDFQTLRTLVEKGRVRPRSIVRGPTTDQLWRFAMEIKGLSREFGLCYACGKQITKTAIQCPHCKRLQEPPADPNVLVERNEPRAPRPVVLREIKPAESPRQEQAVKRPADATKPRETRPIGAVSAAAAAISTKSAEKESPRPDRPASPVGQAARKEKPRLTAPAPTPPAPAPAEQPVAPAPAEQATAVAPSPAAPLRRPPATSGPDDEGILSARELAAAFQLDYTPARAAFARKLAKAAAVLLLLGAVAAGVLLYLNPPMRNSAIGWTEETWNALTERAHGLRADPTAEPEPQQPRDQLAGLERDNLVNESPSDPRQPQANSQAEHERDLPAYRPPRVSALDGPFGSPSRPDLRASPPPSPESGVMPPPVGIDSEPAPIEPSPPVVVEAVPAEPAEQRVMERPVEQPAPPAAQAARDPEPQSVPVETAHTPEPQPAQQPQPVQPPVETAIIPESTPAAVAEAPQPEAPAEPEPASINIAELSPSEARTLAFQLRRDAIDAEVARDYDTAVRLYEQIMEFPREVRPQDTEPRLHVARRQLEERSRRVGAR